MKTRDIRSLGEYIDHFKRYNRDVVYDTELKMDNIGIIEVDEDENVIFVPVLYNGRYIRNDNY